MQSTYFRSASEDETASPHQAYFEHKPERTIIALGREIHGVDRIPPGSPDDGEIRRVWIAGPGRDGDLELHVVYAHVLQPTATVQSIRQRSLDCRGLAPDWAGRKDNHLQGRENLGLLAPRQCLEERRRGRDLGRPPLQPLKKGLGIVGVRDGPGSLSGQIPCVDPDLWLISRH
jgi:hypothetical protein